MDRLPMTTPSTRPLNARSLAVVLFTAAASACAGYDDSMGSQVHLEAGTEPVQATAPPFLADERILTVDFVAPDPGILTSDIASRLGAGAVLAGDDEEGEVAVLTVPSDWAGERRADQAGRLAEDLGDATLTTDCGAPLCYVLYVLEAPEVRGELLTQRARPTWYWTVPSGAVGFTFRVDEGAWSEVTAEVRRYTAATALAEGPHTFEIAAVDLRGNLSELATFTTWVDLAGTSQAIPVPVTAALDR